MFPKWILKNLYDKNMQVRDEAILFLEVMGKEAVKPLTDILTSSEYVYNSKISAGAIDALGRIGDIEGAWAIIIGSAINSLWPFDQGVIRALIKIGEKTNYETVLEYFNEILCNDEYRFFPIIRARIIRNLGYMVKHAVTSHENLGKIREHNTSILKNELLHPFKEVRFAAAFALFDLGSILPITKVLNSAKSEKTRLDMALVLKNIAYEIILSGKGRHDIRKIKRALNRARYDDDKVVRKAARDSLRNIENAIQSESDNKISKDHTRRAFLKIFEDVIITEEDCGSTSGIFTSNIIQKNKIIRSFRERIMGRYSTSDIKSLENGKMVIKKGDFITKSIADKLEKTGRETIGVRSVLHCYAKNGVCLKCFGRYNFAGDTLKIGENIGKKAASWWARLKPNKHLINILKAQKPVDPAILCEFKEACVEIKRGKNNKTQLVLFKKKYQISEYQTAIVSYPEFVSLGQELTSGKPDPKDVFRLRGLVKLSDYIINEMIYYIPRSNFDERIVELFVREARKVKIVKSGDSEFKKDEVHTLKEFINENTRLTHMGKHISMGAPFFAGIKLVAL